jgi:pimeloyl-ACP methyl ester carboxylesterase
MNPILLLHGALGAAKQLDTLKASLEKYNPKVFTLNLSGHGGAPFSSHGFGIEQFAEEVMTFLNTHDIPFVDTFGYSMGGYVALYAGMQWPSRFRKIATLGTKFDWTPTTAAAEIQKLNPEKIIEKVPSFADYLRQMHAPHDWKLLVRETARMMHDLGIRPTLDENNLGTIQQTVMILSGEKDTMSPLSVAESVAAQIPFASFKLLSNTPHALEKVDHAKLAILLQEFFH